MAAPTRLPDQPHTTPAQRVIIGFVALAAALLIAGVSVGLTLLTFDRPAAAPARSAGHLQSTSDRCLQARPGQFC